MKRVLIFCLLCASPLYAQQHADVVACTKTALVAAGHDLSGPCGAFDITEHVAWALKAEGAGLLGKTAGNNCKGYATDIIAYPNGTIFDILIDSGASNGPTWNPDGTASPYHAAIDPGDGISCANATPPPPTVDLKPIEDQLAAQQQQITVLQNQVAQISSEQSAQRDALNNIDQQQIPNLQSQINTLASKPIPTSCSVPFLSCKLH